MQDGGHQEKDLRAGTENVAGIVGLGKAIELSYNNIYNYNRKLTELRDYYTKEVERRIPYTKVNGHRTKRLPGNSNISFEFIDGEALLLNLDMSGICASTGSACSSGSSEPSHVLLAMGIKDSIARGSLRITFGDENTKEDVDYLVNTLEDAVQKLRQMSPEYLKFIKNKL